MNPQDLRKQAMKLRHPTFTGNLSDEHREIAGEAANLLAAAAQEIDDRSRQVIRIVFTTDDVIGMAEDLGVSEEAALTQAWEWGKHIAGTASSLCSDQLSSAIAFNQP